jgi:hypothetical protein
MTLPAGASCQWVVTYHNALGALSDFMNLHLDAGPVQTVAIFIGVGKP